MSDPRAPAEVVEALRTAIAALDLAALVEAGRAAAELLDSAPRWRTKTTAAREAGTTVEAVRGLCRRGKVATRFEAGREHVDVVDLRRVLAARRPQTTASRERESAQT